MSGVGGGSFYYGDYGFLYKQKPAGGGRRSTKFGAGGGATTNGPTTFFNKYKGGDTGIGRQPTALRRAKNNRATICGDKKCGKFFNTLGRDDNYSKNMGMNNMYNRSNYTIFPVFK
jgi:hypothetical protein|tara:strand:- start:3837 stop:4184 length:348 start_codon:yes stop_codon:yes gene_type:complete